MAITYASTPVPLAPVPWITSHAPMETFTLSFEPVLLPEAVGWPGMFTVA